jgi:UDP-2,3-diacylglucosamine pyrophosphatase LpxH
MTTMQPLTILNDLHIGAQRAAGTTPLTAWQLRQYLNSEFERLVQEVDTDLCILGDLFDTGNVPMADVLAVWETLRAWLSKGCRLYLVKGNHDDSRNTTVLSSFQFLCRLLSAEFGDQAVEVSSPQLLADHGAYVLCHVTNQDIFDQVLATAPACDYWLIHANFNNSFAVQADHSLNVSLEQAMKAPAKHLVFAHEHQARKGLNGKVFVAGNQFPSSVADCLGNEAKYLTRLAGSAPERVQTWNREGNYAEQDWRALKDDGCKFIRVVGEASAAEAADVVSAISKFRNKAKALVITNAVKIEGTADGEQIQITLEQVKSFDVLSALLECLDEREQGVVKGLLANRETA